MPGVKRYVWLDLIKSLACFLVIVNHSHSWIMRAGITNGTVLFDAVIFSISKIAVPLFVMTTGYLLLQKEVTWKKTFLRILRVGAPLLVLSVYYYFKTNGESGTILNFLRQFVETPQAAFLWYLYMLIGLYLAMPFVIKIVKNSSDFELIVFAILFLIIPAGASFITSVFHYRFHSDFFAAFFPTAIGYLVAGFVFARIPLKSKYFYGSVMLFVVAILVFVLSILIPYTKIGEIKYIFDTWQSLPVMMASLSAYYFFRYIFENRKLKHMTAKVIGEISGTTFGIYLIHISVIDRVFYSNIFQRLFSLNPFIGVIAAQSASFIICGGIIFVLKKIPGVKWFL